MVFWVQLLGGGVCLEVCAPVMDPDVAGGIERFDDAVRLEDAGAAIMAQRVFKGRRGPMTFATWLESRRARHAQLG